ncbi:dual specificity protein kinase Ttk isoform X1 [Gambusia affinis]|uniref:dual specificity protein kinase Ttk isoform X1 n=1 Tax=Gambusia affinis TaxID=33528 RepID=UPI001CDCB345|nr:dual specificity protein kinase Ttk isoform X1 [Gambusia affinis]XP_043974113.1 dual specificity protein kinase Ttk isoform X1 [Gambusia affinis]
MEEEEHTDRKQQLARLYQRFSNIKKYFNEDDTDNINQIIGSNSPESCLSYLTELEKKRDPLLDQNHLTRLIDFYTRVFSNMPLGKHCHNESYARMLVRFAELKALQDVNEAEANFNVATAHSQSFAFVHVAHAQFEHSQGNTKRAVQILQNALEVDAKPKEPLVAALQSMQAGKTAICLEDKENFPALSNRTVQDSVKKDSEFPKPARMSDGTGELQLSSIFSVGTEPPSGALDDPFPAWRTGSHRKRAVGLPGRVPVVPFSIPENDDDIHKKVSKSSSMSVSRGLSRQTSGSNGMSGFGVSSSRKSVEGRDVFRDQKPSVLSPDHGQWEDQADSTATLLQTNGAKGSSKIEDVTFNFEQVVNSNSPESCWKYLMNLEKRGNPHTDVSLLNKLKDCYSKVFSRLPIRQYSKNTSYARILVRYAELKGIEDPDEAQDHFIVARSNCKGFAFVHIAHAQFEVSQGNLVKATSILHKALALNAKPAELLETATRNLKSGEKQLVPPMEDDPPIAGSGPPSGGKQKLQLPARIPVSQTVDRNKPASKEPDAEWKIPSLLTRQVSPEDKRTTPPDPRPVPRLVESYPTPSIQLPSKPNPQAAYQTPNGYRNPHPSSFITPVVKRGLEASSSAAAPHRAGAVQQACTPLSHTAGFHTPQVSLSSFSNESITIKGKQFFILKMIGRGGSSKVYQVLDHKMQLFAVKYVNLEEADAQTIESYKNEIEHLNHLQQYSDQIIKLYDHEISNSYIYMLMECGNLDLNTWLRNRKTVNPLERKFYWKNMLEAVHTIHKHGIVHSDLKPANFVIVNASLKLIDFGIANRIQPDVTSIMKDSQVGTLNYMPPEAIKDTSSQPGKARSKISPKGDVWSLGCILYCMTYGKTPFQSITNQIAKLQAIIDPSHKIEFPDIAEKDLLDVLKRCLVRNPRERISIAELLEHQYLQLKPQSSAAPERPSDNDLKRILTDLAALQSPNSIIRAANNLAKMCNSGRKLDVTECAKSSS